MSIASYECRYERDPFVRASQEFQTELGNDPEARVRARLSETDQLRDKTDRGAPVQGEIRGRKNIRPAKQILTGRGNTSDGKIDIIEITWPKTATSFSIIYYVARLLILASP